MESQENSIEIFWTLKEHSYIPGKLMLAPSPNSSWKNQNAFAHLAQKIFTRTLPFSNSYNVTTDFFPFLWKFYKGKKSEVKSEVEEVEFEVKTQEFNLSEIFPTDQIVRDWWIKEQVNRFLTNENLKTDPQFKEEIIDCMKEAVRKAGEKFKAFREIQEERKVLKTKKQNFYIFEINDEVQEYNYEKRCYEDVKKEYKIFVEIKSASILTMLEIIEGILEKIREEKRKLSLVRTFGFKDESEMKEIFDWTNCEFKPYMHQLVMYMNHMMHDFSLDGSDPGTGKSLGFLMACHKRFEENLIKKVLIICPSNQIRNWERMIKKFFPQYSVRGIMEKTWAERAIGLSSSENFIILNYEAFRTKKLVKEIPILSEDGNGEDKEILNEEIKKNPHFVYEVNEKENKIKVSLMLNKLAERLNFDWICLDEGHRIKNPDAQQTKAIFEGFKNVRYKSILTGTLLANKEWDLILPTLFLNRHKEIFMDLYRDGPDGKIQLKSNKEFLRIFQKAYFYGNNGRLVPRKGTLIEIREAIENFGVAFKKEECLDLPEKNYELVELPMGSIQERKYIEALKTSEIEINEFERVKYQNILGYYNKMTQLCNGFVIQENVPVRGICENPKLDWVLSKIEELGIERNLNDSEIEKLKLQEDFDPESIKNRSPKLVIWATFQNDIEVLVKEIRKLLESENACVGVYGKKNDEIGSPASNERFLISEKFQDPNSELRVLVAHPKTMGEGIDLYEASEVVFYNNSLEKVLRDQAENRVHRIGMKNKKPNIYDLTCVLSNGDPTVDGIIREAYLNHQSVVEAVMSYLGVDLKKVDEKSFPEVFIDKSVRRIEKKEEKKKEKERNKIEKIFKKFFLKNTNLKMLPAGKPEDLEKIRISPEIGFKNFSKSLKERKELKHKIQKPSECVLTSIATVLNVSVERLKMMAFETLGKRKDQEGLTNEEIQLFLEKNADSIGIFKFVQELPLKGRGLILIKNPWAKHMIAFCDGRVYDPSKNKRYEFSEYFQTSIEEGWKIESIRLFV